MSFEAPAAPSTAHGSAVARPEIIDLIAAIAIVAIMASLSWLLAGAPGTNGIDDAAITRSYSDNIARGYGFVYNAGGEHVEGATSMLWVLVLVVPYIFGGNPEIAILSITALLTVAAVYLALGILRRVAAEQGGQIVALALVGLLGLPGFFIWSVWSMMEIALWCALIMLLLDRLSALAEAPEPGRRRDWALLAAAVALPLTRPEGIAVAVGLIVLGLLLRPGMWRPMALALLGALGSCAALTVGRLAYFGVPFPNTYYAKVSADRLQNVVDGAKYLASFVFGMPFAEVIVLSWVIYAGATLAGLLRGPLPGQRSALLACATVFGMLFVYVALGGDHFAFWRFYQPVMPILLLPILIAILRLAAHPGGMPRRAFVPAALTVALLWITLSSLYFRQARFDIAKEYTLSARGEAFGTLMNSVTPRPSMGVTAAGGIALTYEGELRDLMGLNWVEMAHANPIKVGFRNHASFDEDTFWKYPPELVPQFDKPYCQRNQWLEPAAGTRSGVSQVFLTPRFQEAYVPIVLDRDGPRCTNAFAARDWLSQVDSDRVTILDWGASAAAD